MDQSPAPQGTRYGVPARRKEIAAKLAEAYTNDMLDQREFETRLERAEAAATMEELEALVADFGLPVVENLPAPLASTTTFLSDQKHVLVAGGPEKLESFSLLGDLKIDLRAFRGSGKILTVRIGGGVGSARLKVPAGTRVIQRSRIVLGESHQVLAKPPGGLRRFWDRAFGTADRLPDSPFPVGGPPPTLILEGLWVMGEVVIEESLP